MSLNEFGPIQICNLPKHL